jgi:hypothetical protein
MSSVVIAGDTSGSVTLQAPAVAGSTVLTLPATSGPLGLPVGTIIPFAGTTAPTGFLACPTTATNISRTTYANLFAAIGTTWGTGDGSTTFGMPYFPTGYGAIAGTSGSTSVGAVISHTHSVPVASGGSGVAAGGNYGIIASGTTGATGGSANLGAGSQVLFCVKY